MKAAEFRKMSMEELAHKKRELEEELFNLRYRKGLMQLENVHRIKDVKKDIARINTIIHEAENHIRPLNTE